MYIPHYINAALPKTMSRTQQVRHTVKSFRIFSLLTTIAAVMCDWTQLNYYTQLSLNDTFWGGVSVSIIVVLGLDVSMFFLGTVLNQYRKATGTTKGNFRFIGIGLLVTFLIAYVVYSLYFIRSRVGNECGEKKLQMQPQNRRNIPLQICLFQSRQQNICACNLN